MNKNNDMKHLKHPGSPGQVAQLRVGAVAGDSIGGRSFDDATAHALEARSNYGWDTVPAGPGITFWTIIRIDK